VCPVALAESFPFFPFDGFAPELAAEVAAGAGAGSGSSSSAGGAKRSKFSPNISISRIILSEDACSPLMSTTCAENGGATRLDGHARDVESMGEEDALAKHALVPRRKLDLGDGERVPQVQRTVHVRERKVAEPLGELRAHFLARETRKLFARRRFNLEGTLGSPARLSFCLEVLDEVAFAGLSDG
jgi:hypothetical protein